MTFELRELVRGKSPAQDLADLAAEEKADLIVIGYRHRTKSGKYFLGSDAQDILLAAPCPVLAGAPAGGRRGLRGKAAGLLPSPRRKVDRSGVVFLAFRARWTGPGLCSSPLGRRG